MPEPAIQETDTTTYPAFASKEAEMEDLAKIILEMPQAHQGPLLQHIFRKSNTDTSAYADPTYRHTSLGIL